MPRAAVTVGAIAFPLKPKSHSHYICMHRSLFIVENTHYKRVLLTSLHWERNSIEMHACIFTPVWQTVCSVYKSEKRSENPEHHQEYPTLEKFAMSKYNMKFHHVDHTEFCCVECWRVHECQRLCSVPTANHVSDVRKVT